MKNLVFELLTVGSHSISFSCRRDCNYYNFTKIRNTSVWKEDEGRWVMPKLTTERDSAGDATAMVGGGRAYAGGAPSSGGGGGRGSGNYYASGPEAGEDFGDDSR